MNKKEITVKEIIKFLGDSVAFVDGNPENLVVDNLSDVAHVNSSSLDWVKSSHSSQLVAEASKANTLLVGLDVIYSSVLANQKKVLIHVNNPKVALAQIGNAFFVEKPLPGIHPTAIIHEEAEIGEDVCIGPYVVIGKSKIGNGCVIESGVRIYDNVSLGHSCRIKPGAVIGGEGFGFVKDENGNKFRFPQIGRVLIGDDVEIGANTCIDRGALSDTIIGDYVKINNLCHIAHNNVIGRNVTIAGCVNISGSNVIEDDVWIAPNACIRGFLNLGRKCVIGMGATVTKNVPPGETWVGNPARKLK